MVGSIRFKYFKNPSLILIAFSSSFLWLFFFEEILFRDVWSRLFAENTSAFSTVGNPLAYYADVEIYQLDRSGSEVPTKAYKLIDAYPTNVSAIELSYDANDAVEEFTVEMSFQYWTSNTTS